MKILITYSGQTGNTRQIAEAIFQELDRANAPDLTMVDELKTEDLFE